MPERFLARLARGAGYALTGNAPANWFGPQQPMAPQAPPEVAGRQFDYPFGFNLAVAPRSLERTGFDELRGLADSCDLLRAVIETRKDQMERLTWRIRPRALASSAAAAAPSSDPRIAALTQFFASPDRRHSWGPWLRMLLEDLLVIDAPTLYKRRARSGALYALEILDGATIKRLIDEWGRTPAPPAPAYQQVLKGLPAVDYTADELIYAPRNPRIDLIVIDEATGVASVIAGTPAGTPVAPALTPGKKQIAQIAVPNGTSAIGNASITDARALWHSAVPGMRWAIAGGASDAITASYAPANAALADGLVLGFRATAANTTASPSFNADGLGAKTITKYGGQALLAGNIAGALAECLLRYNAAFARWELLNPKSVSPPVTSVNGQTGAVSLASSNLSDGGTLVHVTDGNAVLSNTANYAVRGEGVSEFANDAGYVTAAGYGGLYSYTIVQGPGYSAGTIYSLSGLAGSWQCMGVSTFGGACEVTVINNLFQRIA